jgi:outer membrane immunogenic protein
MRRILVAAAAIIAILTGTPAAQAADVTAYPAYPPSPVTPVLVQNWTGFYVGASLGARWVEADWTTTSIGDPAGPADPFSSPASFANLGFRGGAYGGFNWQLGQSFVVGVDGDFAWADNKQTKGGIPGTFGSAGVFPGPLSATLTVDASSVRERWDAGVRGRAGILVTPTLLFYATGGIAWQDIEVVASCTGGAFNASWCIAVRSESASTTLSGWSFGGGIEVLPFANWLVRAEYRYSDFGSFAHTFFPGTVDQVTASIHVKTHTALVGAAYKFGP